MGRRPITKEGYKKLMGELNRLRTVERARIMKDLEEARAHGDISENAEFDAAKEKQAFVERKIKELEAQLSDLEIIDADNLPKDRVTFGCTVVIKELDTGDEVTYQIVGEGEADVTAGKISVMSPVASAILGKKINEVVAIETPGGAMKVSIVKIL